MNVDVSRLAPRYDPFAPDVLDDPYPVYARLRAAGRLARAGPGQWAVTHYDDVAALLRSHDVGSAHEEEARAFSLGSGPINSFYGRIVLYRDPPAHAGLRRLLGQSVSAEAMSAVAARLPAVLESLFEPLLDGHGCEAMSGIALPLSLRVLCDLVGFPHADAGAILPHALDLSRAFATRVSEADRQAADAAVVWLRAYVGDLLASRRRTPRADLLSRIGRDLDTSAISAEDVIDNLAFLLFAGFETTAHQIGNALAALLDHPDQLARLRVEPGLVSLAVDELLRFDPPIQGVARVVRAPILIGDRPIRAGRVLVLLLGSANRDGARFAEPDRLDVGRTPNLHVSFGGGPHYCLGAPLARLELAALLRALLQRTRSIASAGPAVRQRQTRFRGYVSLPLSAEP
jgi:cytochrome P450